MIKRLPIRCAMLGLVLLLGFQSAAAGYTAGSPARLSAVDSALRVLESNDQGMVVELTLPPFEAQAAQSDAGPCQSLNLPGWGLSGQPGQPALPVKGVLFGIPAGAIPSVSVLESAAPLDQDGFDLCPAPRLEDANTVGSDPAAGLDLSTVESLVRDPAAYAAGQQYPGPLVVVALSGALRSQQVAQLRFQPFQYNPVTRRLQVVNRLTVRLTYGARAATGAVVDEGPYESVLADTLLNYDAARAWRVAPAAAPAIASALQTVPTPAYRLEVSQDGIYRLSYQYLKDAGVPVDTLDPRSFRLLNQGVEVTIDVDGAADGKFDDADSLLFYGQKVDTRFTGTNVYWLTWGGANGLPMTALDGTPGAGTDPGAFRSTVHLEQDKIYTPGISFGPDDEHWYWNSIQAIGAPAANSYTITLPHISTALPADATAVVRGLIHTYTPLPQHHINIYVNDQLVKADTWTTQADTIFEWPLLQSILTGPTSTIKVECTLDSGVPTDMLLVKWFEVEYSRDYAADNGLAQFSADGAGDWRFNVTGFDAAPADVWDITQPTAPQRIANFEVEGSSPNRTLVFQQNIAGRRQYIAATTAAMLTPDSIVPDAPSDLLAAGNSADYIIISHPDFLAAIQPLADYRAAHGLRVKVINVQDIYDEFSGGSFDPNAIRDFLQYAYTTWTRPAPTYVLLVGDGNYDFRNFTGRGEPNYIPPFLADADPFYGEVAADNRYVAFDSSNWLPDMALGRLPVKTAAETTAVVQKIIGYQGSAGGDWTTKALFAADNADDAGNFPVESDMAAGLLPAYFTIDKVYLPAGQSSTSAGAADARAAIVAAINQGRVLVNYVGHSSTMFWTYENIFGNALSKNDLLSLTNATRLPFVISMTCLTGYYIYPSAPTSDASSLDESLLRLPGAGAVATFSPTGKGVTPGHHLLDEGLFQAIFSRHVPEIGLSTDQAKIYLYANSSVNHDLIDTTLLFGDPALTLPLTGRTYLPLTFK